MGIARNPESGQSAKPGVFRMSDPSHIINGVPLRGINSIHAWAKFSIKAGRLPLGVKFFKIMAGFYPFIKCIFAQQFFSRIQMLFELLNATDSAFNISVFAHDKSRHRSLIFKCGLVFCFKPICSLVTEKAVAASFAGAIPSVRVFSFKTSVCRFVSGFDYIERFKTSSAYFHDQKYSIKQGVFA